MADNVVFREYEQRKNIGKMTGDKKYSMACKDIEKKLSRLHKRINDLQNQRKSVYKNSFQIKRKVHNQTNQIVKCYHERERNILIDVDDAFLAQDASIGEELSNLIATHARCHTLYSHLNDFKGDASIIPEIEKMLFSVNWNEKTTFKPLEFSSNFEQAKVDASNYGFLEGDFVGKNVSTITKEERMSLNGVPNQIQENVFPKSCCSQMNALSISNDKKKLNADFYEKTTNRERKDSQDSFELVDILEDIQNEGDKDFFVDEKESNSRYLEKFAMKGEDLSKWEESYQSTKSAKYPEMERQLTNLQMRLENLVTSAPKLSASIKCNPQNPEEYCDNQFMEDFKILNVDKHDGWLSKNPREISVKKTVVSEQDVCTANSAANLIRKAFSPYFINESRNNWLSK